MIFVPINVRITTTLQLLDALIFRRFFLNFECRKRNRTRERQTNRTGKSNKKNSYFNGHTNNELTNTLVDSQFPFSPALIAAYKRPCVVFLLLFSPICSSSFVFHPPGECVVVGARKKILKRG